MFILCCFFLYPLQNDCKLSKTDHPVFRKGFVSFLKPDRYVKRKRTARRSGPVFETSRIRVSCRNGFGVNTWQIVMDHPYIVAGSRQIQTLERRLFQHRSVKRIS